jgi:hypothetical protein
LGQVCSAVQLLRKTGSGCRGGKDADLSAGATSEAPEGAGDAAASSDALPADESDARTRKIPNTNFIETSLCAGKTSEV